MKGKLGRRIGFLVLVVLLAFSSLVAEAFPQEERAGQVPAALSGPSPASPGEAGLPPTPEEEPAPPPPSSGPAGQAGVDSHRVVATVPLGQGVGHPADIAANPTTGLVYTANPYEDTVSVIRATELIATLPAGESPGRVAADPDTGLVYVALGGPSAPDLAILSGTEVLTTTSLGCKAEAIEVNPVNRWVYVAHAGCSQVSILSGTEVLAQVAVGGPPQALAAHPSTGLVYVVAPSYPYVTVLSGTGVLTTTYVGGEPSDVDVDPESGRAYVANLSPTAGLAVLSGTEVLTAIPLGTGARRVRVDPAEGLVYTSNSTQTVSVIAGTVLTATLNVILPDEIEVEPGGLVYLEEEGRDLVIIRRTEVISRVPGGVQAIGVNPGSGLVYVAMSPRVLVFSGAQKVGVIPPPPNPGELLANPRNGLVYDTWDPAGLLVVSGTEVVAHLLREGTSGGVVNPASGLVYVESAGFVAVVSDTTVVATMTVPSGIYGFACNPANGLIYGTMHYSHQVVILSGTEVITTVAVGRYPYAVDVNPRSGLAYVVNSYGRSLSILSGTVPLATIPFEPSVIPLGDVTVNPATGLVYVGDDDRVWVISGTEVLTNIHILSPGSIVVNPATGLVYVESADRSIVILRGIEIVAEVELGGLKALVAAHPTLPYVYATGEYSDTHLLFVLLGTSLVETIPVGRLPFDVVVNPVNGYVYVAQTDERSLLVLEIALPYRIYLPFLPKVSPPPNPPGMEAPIMVYDTEREVLVLYDGGSWKFGWPLWEYDGSSWHALHPDHIPLLGREAGMAYDQARRRVVAGGMVGDYYEAETWEYDGNDWYRVLFWYPGYVAARMVYDQAQERVVLFGGYVGWRGGSGYSNRTWEYDGSTWIQVHTAYTPTCRAYVGLAYDSDRQVSVLFGGYGGPPCTPAAQAFLDTWEYDGNDWHPITPTHSPSARSGHAMAYDARRKVTVLFGGYGPGGVPLNDTWEYDGSDWHLVTPTLSPPPRAGHAMAYDAARGVVVLFGGHDPAAGYYADTWTYDGTTWRHVAGPTDGGL